MMTVTKMVTAIPTSHLMSWILCSKKRRVPKYIDINPGSNIMADVKRIKRFEITPSLKLILEPISFRKKAIQHSPRTTAVAPSVFLICVGVTMF